MNKLTSLRWRVPLVASGLAMGVGGRLHPESDAEDSLRDELATMTSGDTWVLSHSMIVLSTVLLAAGLWIAVRERAWPSATHRVLRICAIAMSLYVVETIFHLASAVDSEALAAGDAAPVAFTHVGLAVALYPLSGLAVSALGVRQFAAVDLPRKLLAVVAIVGGLLHAASVPLTLIFPDTEFTPVFAGAGMLFAVWALGTGLTGVTSGAERPIEHAVGRPSESVS